LFWQNTKKMAGLELKFPRHFSDVSRKDWKGKSGAA